MPISTPVTRGRAATFDIPAPQTVPISAVPGDLLEVIIFGLGGTLPITLGPGTIAGVTWIEIGFGSSGNESGGVWAGIVTAEISEVPIPINYTSCDQVAWFVTRHDEYAEGAGGANAYAQGGSGVFSRGPTSRTMSALGAPENVFRAALAAFGPPTMTIGVTSAHGVEDTLAADPPNNVVQGLLLEGTPTEIAFSYDGGWFPASIVAYEIVHGTGGPEEGGGGGPTDDGLGPRLDAAVWFTSGHSLIDEPLNQYVALLATDVGAESDWNRQYRIGSPKQTRTLGDTPEAEPPFSWAGYSLGDNRSGSGLNLIEHFRDVSAVGGKTTADPYTHLITAEGHDVLVTLADLRTVPLVRHYYELIREGSPSCLGYFFSTWLEYDIADLPGWIAYARETDTAHAAMVGRINASLAHEGRSDRMMLLPAAGALAELVEQATTGTVAGITGATAQDTIDVIFADEVHLTSVGFYFIACVVYGAIYRRDPRGRAYPVTVTATQAASLQAIAWTVLSATYGTAPHLGPQLSASASQAAIVDYVATFAPWYDLTFGGPYNVAEREAFFAGTSSDMHFDPPGSEDLWLAAPGEDGITGSGGATIDPPTASGSGGVGIGGSGSATIDGPTASSTGVVGIGGTGAASVDPPTASGSGSVGSGAVSGAGAADVTPPTASGSGVVGIGGSGSASVTGPTAAGTGSAGTPSHTLAPRSRRVLAGMRPVFKHDPDEVLDYSVDWTRVLAADGDTIASSTWTRGGSLTAPAGRDSSNDSTTATVWLATPTAGVEALATNRITTTAGRTYEWSVRVLGVEK